MSVSSCCLANIKALPTQLFSLQQFAISRHWPFRLPSGETISVTAQGSLSCNEGQYILNAALKGLGVCFAPSIKFKHHVYKKELNLLLEDYYLPSVSISVIYPLNRNLSRRVRLLIDFLAEELST